MKPLSYKDLKSAEITHNQNRVYSENYQDIYFNTTDGSEESNYVFIDGNDLRNRWAKQHQQSCFCIAETGFGSGLNFLSTCLAWQQSQQKPQQLHFISTELHPLPRKSLQKIHQQFPQLAAFSQKLLDQYGSMRAGLHRFLITEDITLSLLFGDVVESLEQLNAKVDAWFLDGFAPSCNPDMWRPHLFKQMARLSNPNATLATFSAAAVVKKGLSGAGFEFKKRPGFGRKREMLIGHFAGEAVISQEKQPWHPLPPQTHSKKAVTILGAGIAGLCLAKSFHQAGFQTTIIDQHQHPLQQASGNGYAMVMPLITAQKSPEALFYLRAFDFAQRIYGKMIYQPVGVTEHVQSESERRRAENLAQLNFSDQLFTVNPDQISYPSAGFVNAQLLSSQWQRYIDHWLQNKISIIEKKTNCWQLYDDKKKPTHQCETLVVASGVASQLLINQQNLNLTAKLGQTHQLQTKNSLNIKEVQLNQGYIIPVDDKSGHYLIGATFDHIHEDGWTQADFSEIDHLERNLEHWQNNEFYRDLSQAEVLSNHTAVRATTPDHLPICGPVMDEQQFRLDYGDLHHGRHWQTYPEAAVIDNLYVLTGLGSRGFTSAPLMAEYLVAMITGQPLPLEADLCKIIHPNRFTYRKLRKKQ